MKHLNLFGFLAMLFFGIGWANPVPINTRNFKKPRRDMALSAAAGPLSNLLMGVLFALLYEITYSVASVIPVTSESTANVLSVLLLFLMLGSHLNVFLAVFNLLPIPPFDGSRLFYIFLPTKLYFRVMKYERYIMMGILGLLLVESWVLGGRGIMLGGISWLANFIHNGIYYLLGLIPFFRA
ncbi:MAG: site-2 protease family protein [Clostridia bacterium]|nr:site-2 protease family protein [Clostridia bacterium]